MWDPATACVIVTATATATITLLWLITRSHNIVDVHVALARCWPGLVNTVFPPQPQYVSTLDPATEQNLQEQMEFEQMLGMGTLAYHELDKYVVCHQS